MQTATPAVARVRSRAKEPSANPMPYTETRTPVAHRAGVQVLSGQEHQGHVVDGGEQDAEPQPNHQRPGDRVAECVPEALPGPLQQPHPLAVGPLEGKGGQASHQRGAVAEVGDRLGGPQAGEPRRAAQQPPARLRPRARVVHHRISSLARAGCIAPRPLATRPNRPRP
jgi:hypothetical protein